MVRARAYRAVFHVIGVVVFTAAQGCARKAAAELHALHGGDGEQRLRQPVFQPTEHRRADSGGQARHGTLHHAADGVPCRCRRRDLRAHGLACRGIQHWKAAARPLRRKGIERAVRDAPDLRDMGENLHALRRQQLQAQAARHAQGRGKPPGEMPAARGGLCAVIFYGGGVVRVRRTGRILQPGIVRRVGVAVGQHGRQRRAAGQAVRKAAQEFRAVRLAAGARQGAAPRRAPVQKGLQGRKIGPEARREAVEAHAHGRAVRFTKKL